MAADPQVTAVEPDQFSTAPDPAPRDPGVDDLVEDVSIDGMCGVY